MPDLGHDLLFGIFAPPEAARHRAFTGLVRDADTAGLELLGVQDHPYQPAFLDTWTLLAHLSSVTRHIRLVPAVANLPLRPPAVLARSAATLDILSGGRVELGLGAGAFWDAIEAMDGPRRTPGESVTALEEAINVIRALWTPGPGVRLTGEHYSLKGARPGPFPLHPVGIWLGAYKPRMLRLTGRLADGWLGSTGYAPPDTLAGIGRLIDEGAAQAGRAPGAIRRIYVVDTAHTAQQLTELALVHGISGFLVNADPDGVGDVMRFAAETVPAVREAVARERRGAEGGREPAVTVAGPVAGTAPVADADADTDAGSGSGGGTGPALVQAGTEQWTDDPADRPLDPTTRPTAVRPQPEGTPTPTPPPPAGQQAADDLVAVHDHLREEMRQLQQAVTEVLSGHGHPGQARSLLHRMTMRQNYWSLGAFCASYCRLLTTHHLLEDEVMFRKLRTAEEDLSPVLHRLEEEHELIAGLITRLDQALVRMIDDPSHMEEVRKVLDKLSACLLSHLTYEEDELLGAIARHTIVV
ncbi:LLM class flavin-dependent oxidoreductase [Streptomyces sp. NPDC051567]|uniref:LLM class flavin-dependent oxidoreductase n=1 Tax=Streptomyces sp. NPDC051567 TaxID=3365660 RepID=UPI0037B796C2